MKNNVFASIYNHRNIFVFMILFLVLSSPKKVYASNVVASVNTISQLANGINDLTNAGYTSMGYFPVSLEGKKNYQPISDKLDVNVNDLLDVSVNDITLTPLTEEEYSIFTDPVYNYVGQPLDLNEIFIGLFDNGFFTGAFYTDSNGDLIYSDSDGNNPIIDVKHGGNIKTSEDWLQAYYDLQSDILANNYFYSNNGEPVTNNWYYLFFGQTDGTNPTHAYSLYVFNQYNPGHTVPIDTYEASRIYRWLTNDLSNFSYNDFIGNDQNVFQVSTVNRYYNGYTYKYQITYFEGRDFSSYPANNTYENWLAGVNRQNSVFARNGYFYTPSRLTSNQVAFKPLEMDNTKSKIQVGDSYGVTSLNDYVDSISNSIPVPNPDFDYSQSFGTLNYPLIYNISINEPVSSIPNENTYSPSLTYDPSIQYDFSTGIESFQNLQIPFISGLQNRYPFSIPWDIANFIKRFNSEPTSPAWNFDWNITVGSTTYSHHFEGDLSDFNGLAEIFRNLILISFIIALCKFSYDHHF